MSEGVCEAPTFMEWSTMVVPTYPEGGSHALQVCQHHHQVVRVGHFVGLSETQGTRCSRLHRPIRLKPSRYHSAQRALCSAMVHPDRLLAPAPTHKPAVLEAVVLRKRLDNVVAVVARDGAFTLVTEQLGRI